MKPLGFPSSGCKCKCIYCRPKSKDVPIYRRIGRKRDKNLVLAEVEAELEQIKEDRVWKTPYDDCYPGCILCMESEIRIMWDEFRDTNSVY